MTQNIQHKESRNEKHRAINLCKTTKKETNKKRRDREDEKVNPRGNGDTEQITINILNALN